MVLEVEKIAGRGQQTRLATGLALGFEIIVLLGLYAVLWRLCAGHPKGIAIGLVLALAYRRVFLLLYLGWLQR